MARLTVIRCDGPSLAGDDRRMPPRPWAPGPPRFSETMTGTARSLSIVTIVRRDCVLGTHLLGASTKKPCEQTALRKSKSGGVAMDSFTTARYRRLRPGATPTLAGHGPDHVAHWETSRGWRSAKHRRASPSACAWDEGRQWYPIYSHSSAQFGSAPTPGPLRQRMKICRSVLSTSSSVSSRASAQSGLVWPMPGPLKHRCRWPKSS